MASIYSEAVDAWADVQVVVSELVTNAIRADCQLVSLTLDAHHTYVRVATSDDAPGEPVKQEFSATRGRGRGLLIVDALSSHWGVDRQDRGKTVWADVPLTGPVTPTFECAD